MSTARTVLLASLAIAAVVAACGAPTSPTDARSHTDARTRFARFGPLIACQKGTVKVAPCDDTISALADTSNRTTFSYTNLGLNTTSLRTHCKADGTVVLGCTPADSTFSVLGQHTVSISYVFSTRAAPGMGSLLATVRNVNNLDSTFSLVTVNTH